MKRCRYLFVFLFMLSIILICKKSSKIATNTQSEIEELSEYTYLESNNMLKIHQSNFDLEKIKYVQKVAEINQDFSNREYNFFVEIKDLCLDNEDNLYVADSKLHKIFKFNNKQKFLSFFGQEGQGPGEFIGRLRISAGNDGYIYVSDDKNCRCCVFTPEGEFIKQFPLPRTTYDVAMANSRGEIYLLSENGFNVIDCYNFSFKYLNSLLDIKYAINFPLTHPSRIKLKSFLKRPLTSYEVKKIISKNDYLFIVLNYSLLVVCFDQNDKLIHQFRIEHPRIIKDLESRLNDAKKKGGGWVAAFISAFLDNKNNICLCYYNRKLLEFEIYRYNQKGKFIDTLRIRGLENRSDRIMQCDNNGNFYAIDTEFNNVSIYRISNE